jgi:hypothetical protein
MATTTNYGWTTPDDTALVKDGAAAIRTLGSSVDTTTKNLNPSTTLGDIEYRSSTANVNTRLGIGSTGNVLTVAGGVPTWAAPAGGGKVLQVINATYATSVQSSSSTMADTGLSASITPSSASSKVLVMVHHTANAKNNATRLKLNLLRNATVIQKMGETHGQITGNGLIYFPTVSACYLDSPATTSATTYKTQFASFDNISLVEIQSYASDSAAGVSSITLMEIGA